MIEKDLRTYLLDSTAITDVVRNRIFSGYAKQGVRGAILVIRSISPEHHYTLQAEVSTRLSRVQIDCYDETTRLAEELSEKVRNRLSGYSGTAGDITIQSATITSGGPLTEEPRDKSDKWIHRYRLDFAIHHDTTVPTLT